MDAIGTSDGANDVVTAKLGEDALDVVGKDGAEVVTPFATDTASHRELVKVEETLAEEDGGKDGGHDCGNYLKGVERDDFIFFSIMSKEVKMSMQIFDEEVLWERKRNQDNESMKKVLNNLYFFRPPLVIKVHINADIKYLIGTISDRSVNEEEFTIVLAQQFLNIEIEQTRQNYSYNSRNALLTHVFGEDYNTKNNTVTLSFDEVKLIGCVDIDCKKKYDDNKSSQNSVYDGMFGGATYIRLKTRDGVPVKKLVQGRERSIYVDQKRRQYVKVKGAYVALAKAKIGA